MVGSEQHPMHGAGCRLLQWRPNVDADLDAGQVRNLLQPGVDCRDHVGLDMDYGGDDGDGDDGGGDGGGGDDGDGGDYDGDGGDDIVHQGLVPANLTTSGSWVQPGEMLGIELAAGQEGRSSCFDFCICVIV